MQLKIGMKFVRDVRLGSYKKEEKLAHIRVVGHSDYSYGGASMTFEKVADSFGNVFVIIDGKLLPLKEMVQVVEALKVMPSTDVEFWTKEQEDERRVLIEQEDATSSDN